MTPGDRWVREWRAREPLPPNDYTFGLVWVGLLMAGLVFWAGFVWIIWAAWQAVTP